jgi:hypothetical protein
MRHWEQFVLDLQCGCRVPHLTVLRNAGITTIMIISSYETMKYDSALSKRAPNVPLTALG